MSLLFSDRCCTLIFTINLNVSLSLDCMGLELESELKDSKLFLTHKRYYYQFITLSAVATREAVGGPASLPVNISDWSKILKDEYKENHRISVDDDYEEAEIGDRIPPHEFFAINMMASMSMHEGTGRTLKGRDLNRVRNAI
ncbi:hypothetical protein ACS0TY_034579 [Phlomoides rotata]